MKVRSISTVIAAVMMCSSVVFCTHAGELHHADVIRFLAILGLACMAARFKLKLPGLDGSMSVSLPFLLIGALQLSIAEAMLLQCFPGPGRAMRPMQMVFTTYATWLTPCGLHRWRSIFPARRLQRLRSPEALTSSPTRFPSHWSCPWPNSAALRTLTAGCGC